MPKSARCSLAPLITARSILPVARHDALIARFDVVRGAAASLPTVSASMQQLSWLGGEAFVALSPRAHDPAFDRARRLGRLKWAEDHELGIGLPERKDPGLCFFANR
jgi:hypothetical protein